MLVGTFQAIWGAMYGRGPFLHQSTGRKMRSPYRYFASSRAWQLTMFLSVLLEDDKRSQQALHEVEKEAHHHREQINLLSRVSVLGEMTASLAHELSQPLSGIVSNANAGMRLYRQR